MTRMKINWEGVTARIWADDNIHIFPHISLCVCEKVHMCTETICVWRQGVCMSICTHSYRSQRSISDVVSQVLPTCVYGVRGNSDWPEAH